MDHIHIKEFSKDHTQWQMAEIMGLTQGRISQLLKLKRDIYFVPIPGNGYTWYEIRRPRGLAK